MTVRVTYLGFHLLVTVPAVVALVAAGRLAPARLAPAPVDRRRLVGLGVVTAVAVAYTTPWDNYLVGKGVWRYGDGLVAATVWHAPVGEYLFVVLQTVIVGLWLYRVAEPVGRRWDLGAADGADGANARAADGVVDVTNERTANGEADAGAADGADGAAGTDAPAAADGAGRAPPGTRPALPLRGLAPDGHAPTRRQRAAGVAAGLAVAAAGLAVVVAGRALLSTPATLYLGAIAAWVGPPLALQWGVGWPYLWARRRTVAVAVAVPATYLVAADRLAIALGIWRLSPAYTTGATVAGLPVEEAAFFVSTTLLVVQGLVLYDWVVERWRG